MRFLSVALVALVALVGCSSSSGTKPVAVSGKVTYKGVPVPGAMVQFMPTSKEGEPASGRTDASGQYQLVSPKGAQGVPPGEYKVAISRMIGPDGKELPPDVSPFSGGGKEGMPSFYSSMQDTQLTATVLAGASTKIDFALTGRAGGPTGALR